MRPRVQQWQRTRELEQGESAQRINDMSLIIENLPEAIRTTKQQLRAALPEYKEVFREVEAEMRRRVEEIVSERESGHDVIPIVQYKDVAAGGRARGL